MMTGWLAAVATIGGAPVTSGSPCLTAVEDTGLHRWLHGDCRLSAPFDHALPATRAVCRSMS
jgi:hypothetical protein